jgi:hypothetical protein
MGGHGSTLRNGISSHRLKSPVSFAMLNRFVESVAVDRRDRAYVGSIDGEVVVSAQLGAAPNGAAPAAPAGAAPAAAPARGKRKRHDATSAASEAADQAVSTVRAARRRTDAAATPSAPTAAPAISDAAYDVARSTIERVVDTLRGASGESVLESVGLSQQRASTTGASGGGSGGGGGGGAGPGPGERLVVALRLTAGVAVPICALKRAMGPCFDDGLLTTQRDGMADGYQLPITAQGRVVEEEGQRTLVALGSVPNAVA